jgi:hypothetical protein
MNTREISAEYRLAHWAGVMKERRESGLSIKVFCENGGFHENIYYYWQRKLREAACSELTQTKGEAVRVTPYGFAEVKLAGRPAASLSAAGTQCEVSIEVGGVRITATREYPVDKLGALIRDVVHS